MKTEGRFIRKAYRLCPGSSHNLIMAVYQWKVQESNSCLVHDIDYLISAGLQDTPEAPRSRL